KPRYTVPRPPLRWASGATRRASSTNASSASGRTNFGISHAPVSSICARPCSTKSQSRSTTSCTSSDGRPVSYPCAVSEIDYLAVDADNHYYEALDAFTRYVEPAMQPRCVQWCEMKGRKYHVIGGRVSHAVVNPTFDPVAKAGAMHDYFRGNPDGK